MPTTCAPTCKAKRISERHARWLADVRAIWDSVYFSRAYDVADAYDRAVSSVSFAKDLHTLDPQDIAWRERCRWYFRLPNEKLVAAGKFEHLRRYGNHDDIKARP